MLKVFSSLNRSGKISFPCEKAGKIAELGKCFDVKLSVSGEDLIERIDLIVGTYLAKSIFPNKLDFVWEMKFDGGKMPPGKWFYFRVRQVNSEYA